MPFPHNPIAAVLHPDPYLYYAHLVADRPLYRDETLGLWVASSAAMVRAVLTSDICRVRPLTEPIPKALLGSPAATIFGHLVRMNDGERHGPFKQAVQASVQSIEAYSTMERCNKWAHFLIDGSGPLAASRRLQDFAFHLPVYVIANLLGVPQEELHQTALWMSDFVRSLAPASTPSQIEQGKVAAGHLLDLFRSLLSTHEAGATNSLLAALAWEAKRAGCEETEPIIANGIGFLSQAYEATAGLIGNTIVALASHRNVREQVAADPRLLYLVIEEVLRYDPPVQNTRRFLAQNGRVAGQAMQEGDVILVILAAASRDPLANPHPEQFDMRRKNRSLFTFRAGSHMCPGNTLAAMIAQAGIEQLMASGVDLEQLASTVLYRPSVNLRIALLGRQRESYSDGETKEGE
ncbi:MAG TPA: cytochrome P450 [Ktedonobacteraceae bacterium]